VHHGSPVNVAGGHNAKAAGSSAAATGTGNIAPLTQSENSLAIASSSGYLRPICVQVKSASSHCKTNEPAFFRRCLGIPVLWFHATNCAAVWPEDTFVDFDNGLNTAINKIRGSAENPRFIETLARGYRFIAPVEMPATAIRSVAVLPFVSYSRIRLRR